MSKRYFDSMLEDMDYINYYRWCSNQSFTNFGVNMYPNQYDLFNRGCYLPPYTLVPNTSKKNREAYYLFKRNEDRNIFPNFYFGSNHFKGHFNRRFEDNRKLPRSGSIDLMPRNNPRRQFSNWSSPSGQPYNDNNDENWFMKRQIRGFNKDNNFQPSTARVDSRQNKFEYSDIGKKDEMLLNSQLGFHRSSPSLTNDRTTNQSLDNSTKGFGKNSSNIQQTNSTAMSSPKHGSEYDTWFSVDEQQQIINVLKDVNYRHERQLWCDMQSVKTIDNMSLGSSMTSSVDPDSSDCRYGSFSSDEDDGITVLVSPTDHPLNEVMDPEMHLSIASDDLIEKSTSDYFEEFQNIFTTSPEKNIKNTLVKECFKEQPNKILNEETSIETIERNVSKDETVSDQCNNNESEVSLEVASSEKNSSKDSNGNESMARKVTPKGNENTEATKIAHSEKIFRLSPDMPLPRCFESSMIPLVESAKAEETPDGPDVHLYGPVIKVTTEEHSEIAKVSQPEKIQRSSPVIQMSRSFELNKEPVTAAVKDSAVAVLSGSSDTSKSFLIPKYRSVIEMKQISMPTKLQVSSSSDQIVLTDYHRRKIQMQKYNFDCRYKNVRDFKPFHHISQPQNNFPVSQMWKSIRSVYNSSQPSVHSINDYRNFIFNLNSNTNKNFNKAPRVPIKYFNTYEHRERGYRQDFEAPSEKVRVPFPSKNSRISSHRMSEESGNRVQSDSCLLRNFELPRTDYEKSSMSESHLQVKSSKDLDRLYKRISLEELFSSGEPEKPVKSSKRIPPFRSDGLKLDPISSSYVSPTDHLKHILKIGTDGTEVSTTGERAKYQVPFPNKVEKVRISTGCQTEATDDRCWSKTVSETSRKVTEVRSNDVTSVSKAPVVESYNKKKVIVRSFNEKDDLKSDGKIMNVHQSTDDSQNNKFQVEDNKTVNNSAELLNDVALKDEEKGLAKKVNRKKGKTSRNKSKGEFKNDAELSCCEKCRKNIDIMNFSENEMQFDVKQNGTGANSMKTLENKAFEEPVKTQSCQAKYIEKEREKIQVKAVLLDPIKIKPVIVEDIFVRNSYKAKKSKPKNVYKDVFKEFSRSRDLGTSTNESTLISSDVDNKKGDRAIQEYVYDHKTMLESKPFNLYPVTKCSDTSQRLRSDYNSLLRYKMTKPKKPLRKFEKPNTSEDESTEKFQPINEDVGCKSSHEFRSKRQDDETSICDYPSSLRSDKYLENNREDQNIQGPHLHKKFNTLDKHRHPKKTESDQEICLEKVQNQDRDAKNVYDDLTALGTSLKSHIKPAFSKPNWICEKPPTTDGKKSFPKIKERFVHNANAPFQEKWNGLTSPKGTVKNKSEIASTGYWYLKWTLKNINGIGEK